MWIGLENTHRLGVREELAINLVDRCEVIHVCQEDVHFDCFGKAGTASFEDSAASEEVSTTT